MPTLFADSGYWIALLYPDDALYERASATAATLQSTPIVTTQMVLVETLNFMSGLGETRRSLAVEFMREMQTNPNVEIIPQTDAQFQDALERYAARRDQTWSLTDCASFLIMEQRGITDALAYDQDFQQAGFTPLLRTP